MLRVPFWTYKIKADGVSLDPENQSWSPGACQDGWSQPWPGPPDTMKSNQKEPKKHWKNQKKQKNQSLRHYSGLVRPRAQVPIDCQTFFFFVVFCFPNAFLVLFGHLGSRPGLQGWDSMLTGSRAPRTLVWQWTATQAGYRLRQLLSGCSWHPRLHWLHERSQTPEAKTIDYRPQTIDHSLWTMDHKL